MLDWTDKTDKTDKTDLNDADDYGCGWSMNVKLAWGIRQEICFL